MIKELEFLNLLFDEHEGVNLTWDVKDTKVINPIVIGDFNKYNFFSINPLREYRYDKNVTAYRNLLFEIDNISLEQQKSIIIKSELPYTSCVFSGKKSLHYIVSLSSPLTDKTHYTQVWKRIASYLNNVATEMGIKSSDGSSIIDQSCKNPSRLSRFPGALRDGIEQKLIELRQRVTEIEFKKFLTLCPEIEIEKPKFRVVSPLDEQEGKLGLRTSHFLRTGKDYKNEYSWHNMFLLAAKDMKAQNFSYDEAYSLLEGITGHLDDSHDIPNLNYAYEDSSFEMEHTARGKLTDFLLNSHWIYNIEDDKDNFIFNSDKGLIRYFSNSAVKRNLSRGEFNSLLNDRTLDCELKYEPFSNKILYKNEYDLDVFNRYHPPTWKSDYFYHKKKIVTNELPEIYQSFFSHFVNGNEESYEYMLDWMCNSLRAKNRTYLLCIASKGIGKNILYDILEGVHGKANSIITNDTVLKEKFNSQLMNKTLIAFNEVDIRRDSEIDRLKAYADDYMSIEGKGKDAIQVRTYASVLIFSNRSGAVRIEAGDRRFSVLDLTDVKLQYSTYFTHTSDGSYNEDAFQAKIDELMDEENLAQLSKFLWARKINHNMNFPFRSIRFEEMIESALTEWELLLLEKILPSNLGKKIDIRRIQKMILNELFMLRNLGRSKLKDFVKKYSDCFTWKREQSMRLIEFKKPYYEGEVVKDKKFTFK